MMITHLKLSNIRCIKTAEFRFQPGFNLVVGENGVGKTTVIEALAVCVSWYVRYNMGGEHSQLGDEDIRANSGAMDIECDLDRYGPYRVVVHRSRDQGTEGPGSVEFVGDRPRVEPDSGEALPYSDRLGPGGVALGVLYSTNRAELSEKRTRFIRDRRRSYYAALSDREVPLRYFAEWIAAMQALGKQHVLDAVDSAVRRFLPDYHNLRLGPDEGTLVIDRHGATLAVRQLSHGERGILAVVLDLTRWLGEANPGLADPAGEASAVVLIDEIDLHLHPKWQRQIARKLMETFPRCQFIATTHSPQVIGEVEHDRIQIITEDGVYSPPQSFGIDSNRVLEEIMEADPRTRTVLDLLAQIKSEIDGEAFEPARKSLKRLIAKVGEDDPEVTRIRTLLEFLDDQ